MFKIFINMTIKTNLVLTNCRSKGSFRKKIKAYHRFVKFDEYRDILTQNLSIKPMEAGKTLYNHQYVLDLPQEHVIQQCKICTTFNVEMSMLSNNAKFMAWSTNTLTQILLLMREMGVPYVHAALLSKYGSMGSMRVGMFKAATGIPENADISKNLLKCLDKPPPTVAPLEPLSETLSMKSYKHSCLRWYIKWRLNLSERDDEKIKSIVCTLSNRSFRGTNELFHTLHDDIGLTIDQIKRYDCLSAGSGKELRKIIRKVKTFAGLDIRDLIKRHPVLHSMEYDNVIEVMSLLKKNNFTQQSMRRCPEILTVDKDDFIKRLDYINSTPAVRILKNNTRSLVLMIYQFHRIHPRLAYLHYMNINHATTRIFTASPRSFKRFLRTGMDATKIKEIRFILIQIFDLDAKEIIRRIRKHPYWRHISLVAIHDSLRFLLKQFAPEDLEDSIQIILYPRSKIKETFQRFPELRKNENYKPKEILALCLYEMEREHHFSGDGVWEYDVPPSPKLNLPKETDDSENLDSDDAEDTKESLKITE